MEQKVSIDTKASSVERLGGLSLSHQEIKTRGFVDRDAMTNKADATTYVRHSSPENGEEPASTTEQEMMTRQIVQVRGLHHIGLVREEQPGR